MHWERAFVYTGALVAALVLGWPLVRWLRRRPQPRRLNDGKALSLTGIKAWLSDQPAKKAAVEMALILVSVVCVVRGQWLFSDPASSFAQFFPWWLAGGLCFIALLLWADGLARLIYIPRPAGGYRPGRAEALLLTCLGLMVLTLNTILLHWRFGWSRYWDALILWVASWVAYLLAFAWPSRQWWRERIMAHRFEIALVVGMMVVAAGLRFVWLGRIPDIMNGDEGLHGLFARGVVEGRNNNPFSTFYGAGSLHLFVVAIGIKLLGFTPLATRLTPVIGGLLGVPATYLLARRLFSPTVAFVAAGLVAVLHSHIHFSRVLGVGYIHATLFASLGIYLLYSALLTHSRLRAALGGVVLGLWLYVYIDSRFVLAVLAAWFTTMLALPRHRAFVMGNLKQLAVFAGGYLATAAPMMLWAVYRTNDFNARFSSDGTLWNGYYNRAMARDPNINIPRLLVDQVAHVFQSITHYPIWDFYQSPAPLLDTLSAALFWLALIYALLWLLDRRYLLLNIWLWSGVLAIGLLTVPRTSDGYRLLIVFLPIVILLGVVADMLARRLCSALGLPGKAVWGVLALLLTVILAINANIYFVRFAQSCKYGGDRQTRTSYFLGATLATMSAGERVVYVGNENLAYGTHASAQYLNPGVLVQNVPGPLPFEFLGQVTPHAFIVIPERQADLALLQAAFPGGQLKEVRDCQAVVFYVYVPVAKTG